MFLSIIIPAYNEEERIAPTLSKIYSFLQGKNYDFEVIVVDDGSIDSTSRFILESKLNKDGRLLLLKNEKNKGKGFSVKKGILASGGEFVLFTDADLSTPIEEFEELFAYTRLDYDIVIGSRSIEGAEVRVHQPFYRELMGKFFNFLVQIFVLEGFIDTQCGFKLFKGAVARNIANELKIERFGFDVEVLYIAKKKNYKIKEAPVIWINSSTSKVNPLIDSCGMFIDLLRIKKLHE